MRILHTSDWHLGSRLGSQDRLEDQFARLAEICDYLDQEEVDLLLVAGDVFEEHRSDALGAIIRRLARLLRPRVERGMWAVFIAGNHDREYVFPLLRGLQDLVAPGGQHRVVFADRPRLARVTARDETAQLMLLPYPTPVRYELADQRWPSPDMKRADLATALRQRIQDLAEEADRGLPTVLCGHFLLRGVTQGLYHLSEQEDVVMEAGDLPGYAYAALGHIHKPQQVGAPYIRYCGSPERMDRGEAGDDKEVVLVDIGRSGLRDLRPLPLRATPIVHLVAGDEADLAEKAAAVADPQGSLVSLTFQLRRDQSLAPLQARARELFPRLYAPPEVQWLGTARPGEGPRSGIDRRDLPGTVRAYLSERLQDDPDRDDVLRLAEELLAEQEGAPA